MKKKENKTVTYGLLLILGLLLVVSVVQAGQIQTIKRDVGVTLNAGVTSDGSPSQKAATTPSAPVPAPARAPPAMVGGC